MFLERLLPALGAERRCDQGGIRPRHPVDDAPLVFEEVHSKSWERGLLRRIISVGLAEASDRIEHRAPFDALRKRLRQLSDNCRHQTGFVNDAAICCISRRGKADGCVIFVVIQ
eukprot:8396300-Pyramimonas_sp.AAC.1